MADLHAPVAAPRRTRRRPAPGTDDGVGEAEGADAPAGRRRRPSKWDRPPAPHDWRWWVGSVGKVMIAVSLLMFGFVAYQLWGTAIETAAAQRSLEDEFAQQLASLPQPADDAGAAPVETGAPTTAPSADGTTGATPATTTATTPSVAPGSNADPGGAEPGDGGDGTAAAGSAAAPVPVEAQVLPEIVEGDALARIEIPRIGVDDIVVAGVATSDLKRGPGHFPETPMPGQLGNSAIAGHRTTYGQPFFDVDRLQPGDPIRVTTLNGVFTYRVTGTRIVSPSDYGVIATADPTVARLTLTSCHPKWTARQRIIVSSELDPGESSPVGVPVLGYGRDEGAEAGGGGDVETGATGTLPADGGDPAATTGAGTVPAEADRATGEAPTTTAPPTTGAPGAADDLGAEPVRAGIADAFGEGWFSDPSANPQVGLWGLALIAVAGLAAALSRRARRDVVGLLVGIGPFAVALYFFFQNVNRLLPPNL